MEGEMINRPRTSALKRTAVGITMTALTAAALLWWLQPEASRPKMCKDTSNFVYFDDAPDFASLPSKYFLDLDCKEWTKGGTCVPEEFITPGHKPIKEVTEVLTPGTFTTPVYPTAPMSPDRVIIPAPRTHEHPLLWGDTFRPRAPVVPDAKGPCEVPEPGAFWLVLLGAVCLFYSTRTGRP